MTPRRALNQFFWCSKIWEAAPPHPPTPPSPALIFSTPNWSLSHKLLNLGELLHWAERVWLSAQFVRPTAGLCKCCPSAAVGLHCPHRSPLRPASSLLHWATAGSGTVLHSLDVERDITGFNSPTPTRKVTRRLMSVVRSAGYMLGPSQTWASGREMTSRSAVGHGEFWLRLLKIFISLGEPLVLFYFR